jgi:hypothetical protein
MNVVGLLFAALLLFQGVAARAGWLRRIGGAGFRGAAKNGN